MKKINWKVRFKNPVFLAQLFLAFFLPVLAYMGLTLQDITTWGKFAEVVVGAFKNPYVLVLVIGSVYNALNDPTTSGVFDSKQVMTYKNPRKDV